MTSLDKLPKTVQRGKRRLGAGYGSGRGKTAGRGTKGQKARGKIPQRIKMAGISFAKRLPLFRGKYRQKRISTKPIILNLKDLSKAKANTVVDLKFLIEQKIVDKEVAGMFSVKLLGDGDIDKPLTVRLYTSRSARKKIEKAGGTVGAAS